MELDNLIAFINQKHDVSFSAVKPLSGGYQEGAFLLKDASQQKFVLKQSRVPHSIPIIRRLREAGYPTPAYILWGTAPDDSSYLLQEFSIGEPLEVLDKVYTEQLIRLNALQADLNPDPSNMTGSWSDYAWRVVFADESGWSSQLSTYSSETRDLWKAMEEAVRPFASTILVNTDAVHGDFSYGNLLAQNGQITAIVDCAYMGYGTRAFDLATLLFYAYKDEGSAEVRSLLRDTILRGHGQPVLTILLVYNTIALIIFSMQVHGEEGVNTFVQVGWKILRDLKLSPTVQL